MDDIEFCHLMKSYIRELQKQLKQLYYRYPKNQRQLEHIYNILFNMEADIITYCEEKGVR
jgi:site-specific recombinase